MKHSYEFRGGQIILRPLCKSDIEELRLLRNQVKQFFLNSDEITERAQQEWYQRYLEKADDIMFAVAKAEDPEGFIGAIAVYHIDWEQKIAEVGRTMIDKEKAPQKGIGAEATAAICKFSLDVLKLTKIVGVVKKSNERMIKLVKHIGFRFVGDADPQTYALEMTGDNLSLLDSILGNSDVIEKHI